MTGRRASWKQSEIRASLTEIYNRPSLDQLVGRFISHACRRKVPLALLKVDMDKLKNINSRFVHLTGDFVLAEAAALRRNSILGCDAVVRHGGDEFLIVPADTTSVSRMII